jgi:hypothetical protein
MNTAASNSLGQSASMPARKLLPLAAFMLLYGLDSKVAIAVVDAGALWPCFNVAVRANSRRLIRVWRDSVVSYEAGKFVPRPKLAGVIASILPRLGLAPAASVTVKGVELARRFFVKADTISNLTRAGELSEVGTHCRANQSARISYVSAAKFLERRLV